MKKFIALAFLALGFAGCQKPAEQPAAPAEGSAMQAPADMPAEAPAAPAAEGQQ
jgi:hypothetical protein